MQIMIVRGNAEYSPPSLRADEKSRAQIVQGAFREVALVPDLHLKADSLPVHRHFDVKAAEFLAHNIRRYFGIGYNKLRYTG
jgi:hypothetical protein